MLSRPQVRGLATADGPPVHEQGRARHGFQSREAGGDASGNGAAAHWCTLVNVTGRGAAAPLKGGGRVGVSPAVTTTHRAEGSPHCALHGKEHKAGDQTKGCIVQSAGTKGKEDASHRARGDRAKLPRCTRHRCECMQAGVRRAQPALISVSVARCARRSSIWVKGSKDGLASVLRWSCVLGARASTNRNTARDHRARPPDSCKAHHVPWPTIRRHRAPKDSWDGRRGWDSSKINTKTYSGVGLTGKTENW